MSNSASGMRVRHPAAGNVFLGGGAIPLSSVLLLPAQNFLWVWVWGPGCVFWAVPVVLDCLLYVPCKHVVFFLIPPLCPSLVSLEDDGCRRLRHLGYVGRVRTGAHGCGCGGAGHRSQPTCGRGGPRLAHPFANSDSSSNSGDCSGSIAWGRQCGSNPFQGFSFHPTNPGCGPLLPAGTGKYIKPAG